jgi:hypothetical protein
MNTATKITRPLKINAIGKVANPGERDRDEHTYLLSFGAYGCTHVIAYASNLCDAIESAGDWILANAPGLTCTDVVNEEYQAAIAEGLDSDAAWERATVDTISIDSGNHYLTSWEVGYVEDPSRDDLARAFGTL